jgi:hypothetical protein
MPGLYLALSPPVGTLAVRAGTVAVANVVLALMVLLGAFASVSIVTIVFGMAAVAFGSALLPRVEPRAAGLQLPLLVGFIYSTAHPLSDASAASRAAAVLVSLPVYTLSATVLFQTDARKPLVRGAAGVLDALGITFERIRTEAEDAGRDVKRALIHFGVVLGRLKDVALPLGESLDARAYRLLTVSVQQAAADTELLASDATRLDAERARALDMLTAAAHALAAALGGSGPLPDPAYLEHLVQTGADEAVAAVGGSLNAVAQAAAVVRGTSHELPPGLISELPGFWARIRACMTPSDPAFRRGVRLGVACAVAGLIAELADLGRPYWAVFAVVVVLNAPVARSKGRAVMRIVGTVIGFICAIPLLALTGENPLVSLLLGLGLLLPGFLAIPINYAVAVAFITCAVAMLFSSGSPSDVSDFLHFRVIENAIGVAAVCVVGLLLWHTGPGDWWASARALVRTLADAFESRTPKQRRDELLTRIWQLRTETIEVGALPDASSGFNVAWSFLAGAESLARILLGTVQRRVDDPAAIAVRLRAIERACNPENIQTPPMIDEPWPRTLADQEVSRMADAVDYLHNQG